MTDFDRDRRRGAEADRLLDEPLLKEAFEKLEEQLLSEWRSCADSARREAIWAEQKALHRVRGWLKELVTTGKLSRT